MILASDQEARVGHIGTMGISGASDEVVTIPMEYLVIVGLLIALLSGSFPL
jgi:hypothetical protein